MTAYRNPMSKEEIKTELKKLDRMYIMGEMTYSDLIQNKKDLDKKLMELAWRIAT